MKYNEMDTGFDRTIVCSSPVRCNMHYNEYIVMLAQGLLL